MVWAIFGKEQNWENICDSTLNLDKPFSMPFNTFLTSILTSFLISQFKYRSTSLCQTCLSQIHSICRSDHPFPSISPILLCISNLFMSNLVITKSRLYRSCFSFPKISFLLLYHYLCRGKFCVGPKNKQYKCQTK